MNLKNLSKINILLVLIVSLVSLEANATVEKQVKVGTIIINYQFKDEASQKKEEEMTQLIGQAFEIYSKLFGGLPRNLAGEEYSEFVVQVRKSQFSGGEADPQLIKLSWSEEKVFGYAKWQVALLHEIFHLWSAESFRYKNSSEQWFNEGFAEYYAYKTATQLKLYSPQKALSILTHPIGLYLSSGGLGNISMRKAGKTDKTKFDNYFLIYHGGWVVALILDHDIRSKTNGTKSIDDLMAWLYVNFPRHEKLYKYDDIVLGLKESAGIDYSDFFDKYVIGTQVIPISEYFNLSDAVWNYQLKTDEVTNYKYLFQSVGMAAND